jgi:diguanylate cyclase (GGDEF)-like protein
MRDEDKSKEELVQELIEARAQILELRILENEHKKAQNVLQNAKNELELHAREIALLSEMGELLQTCLTLDEAYTVIDHTMQQLFNEESGALCVLNQEQNLVDTMVAWGEEATGEKVFSLGDCWALRRGQLYSVGDASTGIICKHVGPPTAMSYICVPMIAQGETLGVLHIRSNPWGASELPDQPIRTAESKWQLALTVSEHIGLALANLKLRESLRSKAIRDPLTGLFNRRYMEESLERELRRSQRKGVPLGIVMMDIDHFKHFNDTFGHAAGDYLLRELGVFLKTLVRGEDIASRYGGEEFIIVFPETSLEETVQRAEHIRKDVKTLKLGEQFPKTEGVTLSLGVAVFPQHGSNYEQILKSVDTALYQAKRDGRDCVSVAKGGLPL